MNEPLAGMLRYNHWATETLLRTCASLDSATLAAQPPSMSGTIGELLAHLAGGQQTFLCRAQGLSEDQPLGRGSPWPGFERLAEVARISGEGLIALAEGLDTDREVELAYMGRVFRFPVSFFLVHAVEHGVEHRTELKVALNQLGIETPDLDGWSFAAAAGFGRDVGPSS
ncbi:MAG: DinB family protein [Dehalococcoidia bacterium]|nr:DinB family protein [Dehalococcoidia bacterium]